VSPQGLLSLSSSGERPQLRFSECGTRRGGRKYCSLAFIGFLSAQTDRGSLMGTVLDPIGVAVAYAPIQLKSVP